MELADKVSMTLDEIIQQRNIQAPPSTSSLNRQPLQSYRRRGVGFARPIIPRPIIPRSSGSGAAAGNKSLSHIYQTAYQAGVQAGLTFRGPPERQSFSYRGTYPHPFPQRGMFMHRGRFQRGASQHGGFQRGGFQRGGFQRGGFQSGRGGFYPGQFQSRVAEGDGESSKPPLRDRLGWLPGQRLTQAQQVARNKLALAKHRLNGFTGFQGYGPRVFAAAVVRDKIKRASKWRNKRAAQMPPPIWMPGVSPLIRQNVAQLPGGAAPSNSGQSVKSFSAFSRSSTKSVSRQRRNHYYNQLHMRERQLEGNASAAPSIASLQARMRPSVPWGSANRAQRHEPTLDARLQAEIGSLQASAPKASSSAPETLEYRALVTPTLTSTTDRFSLMMSL